jgi:prephenate dehydrogenase
MFNRVAIIGLGLIGGSMGLALRQAKAVQQVIGYDLGKGVSEHAKKVGAIDEAWHTLSDTVRGADLVIIATPVGAVRVLLQQIAGELTPGTVVTDVASTKAQVIKWAEELLPASVAFVGGHPMTGKELSGVDAADGALFQRCIYCLTPTESTSPTAITNVSALVETLGARVRFLAPLEHDRQVAGVSHLPFLTSVALVNTVASDETWGEAALLAANGFRDASRLAAGSPEMYRDICLTNSETITGWLDTYIATLTTLRRQIASRDRDLADTFVQAQQLRLQWHASREES